MPATIAAARAGATTGEWSQTLRDVFGEYRGPTGVGEATAVTGEDLEELRDEVERVRRALGRRLKFLVGKPGLDGHSNGAEQIAVRARDAGMDVVYEGIRLTPAQIASSAAQEGVHVIGLSILSGSHAQLIPLVLEALVEAGVPGVPVIVGGIIPAADAATLREAGVAAVYTPKDWDLNRMIADIVAHRRRPSRRRVRRRGLTGRELGERLRARDLSAAPAVLNLVESRTASDRAQTADLLAQVAPGALAGEAPAQIIGMTGPPGVGKSSLLSHLVAVWRARGRSVAVLAVDPSSRRSGGSLLGDRARIERDPADQRVFIRSTAAGDRLGGLAPATRAAAAALACAFDVVVIETVGVGQSETEVADVADAVAVVVQPGSGDVLQFLKSGIMEIPDVLVVTKSDLGRVARRAHSDLRSALRSLGRGADAGAGRLLGGAAAGDRGPGRRAGRPPRRPRPGAATRAQPPGSRAGRLRRRARRPRCAGAGRTAGGRPLAAGHRAAGRRGHARRCARAPGRGEP